MWSFFLVLFILGQPPAHDWGKSTKTYMDEAACNEDLAKALNEIQESMHPTLLAGKCVSGDGQPS